MSAPTLHSSMAKFVAWWVIRRHDVKCCHHSLSHLFDCNVFLQSHAVVGQLFLSNRVSGCLFHLYFLAFRDDTVEAWVHFLSCGICVVLLCEWDKSRGDQGFYGETKNAVAATGFLRRQPITRSVVAAFMSRRTYAASPSCCNCS